MLESEWCKRQAARAKCPDDKEAYLELAAFWEKKEQGEPQGVDKVKGFLQE